MAEIPFGYFAADEASSQVLDNLAPDPGRRRLNENVDAEFVGSKRLRVQKVQDLSATNEEVEDARLIIHNAEHRLLSPAAGGKGFTLDQ